MALTAIATVDMIRTKFPDAVVETLEFRGEHTIILTPAQLVAVCRYLLEEAAYTFLSSVTAVDWPERQPRFDIVYHLLSIPHRATLRLKVRVGIQGEEHPTVPTVSTIWPGANWYEREVFDLFGIIFSGHPNLRRILMPNDWTTYPLRKDYPLSGFDLPEPHWGGQVPYNSDAGVGTQTLRTSDGRELNENRRKVSQNREPGQPAP